MRRGFMGLLVVAALVLVGFGSGHTTVFTVPSPSMEPTYTAGQKVTVDLDAYDHARPEIGDAVILHPPHGADIERCGVPLQPKQPCRVPTPGLSSQVFLKRVVATPGDRLSIRTGRPVVNGTMMLVGVVQACRHFIGCNMKRTITVLPNHYFVMGDNSGESADSRHWGPVPARAIIGKVTGDEAN